MEKSFVVPFYQEEDESVYPKKYFGRHGGEVVGLTVWDDTQTWDDSAIWVD